MRYLIKLKIIFIELFNFHMRMNLVGFLYMYIFILEITRL